MAVNVNLQEGEVAFRVVIKNRKVVRVEEAEGTEGKVVKMAAGEEDVFRKSKYGLNDIETIRETDTEKSNTCYVTIAGYKIAVPCS